MPSSSHTAGSCSLRRPSRSIRCPPVIFTIRTPWRSATSAIRRSSDGLVTPPRMRGTTENVPSFWMFAWTRSLMKRAWRSSRWRFSFTCDTRYARPGLARAAVAAGSARVGQRAHRLEPALAHDGGKLLARLLPARAQVGRLLRGPVALEGEDLLHERLARPAPRAGAGHGHDLLGRAEALVADRRGDLSLADAVAVAHLRAVGQVRRAGLARLLEQAEQVGHRLALLHLLEQQLVPARVAEQDRAGRLPIRVQHELAVGARGSVCRHHLARARCVADRHQVDSHHLQLRALHRAGVGGAAGGERLRRDGRLLVDGRHEAVDHAVGAARTLRRRALARGS